MHNYLFISLFLVAISNESFAGKVEPAAAVFWLDADSELIFVGDAGTTESSGGAHRLGAGEGYISDAQEFVAAAGLLITTDIESLFESQLKNEAHFVEDIHVHPVASRSLRAKPRYQF